MKKGDTLELNIPAVVCFAPPGPGTMHFLIADTHATVSRGDEEIGHVSGCIGGGIEIQDKRTRVTFFISTEAIWLAYEMAMEGGGDGE